MAGNQQTGSYTGDGAAQNIAIGWVPDYVLIVNTTDGDTTSQWFYGMTDGTSIDTAAAVTLNAADGISALESTSEGAGFSVGTDLSESGKTYHWLAVKSE